MIKRIGDLAVRVTGDGPPVLLVHGAAEDAAMLDPQAEAIAARGFEVIWYDRRGTGDSARTGWPGGGAAGHADDAAALLRELGATAATVLGFSSGGVVALMLAVRHPAVAGEVIAWEPPAVAVLPGGAEMHAGMVAPIEEHLAAHPGDWRGAYRVMLGVISGGEADLSSPAVRRMERNAEAAVRDDARLLTTQPFVELPSGLITVATTEKPDPLHAAIAFRLGEMAGTPPVAVKGADDHEVYLSQPEILAEFLSENEATS